MDADLRHTTPFHLARSHFSRAFRSANYVLGLDGLSGSADGEYIAGTLSTLAALEGLPRREIGIFSRRDGQLRRLGGSGERWAPVFSPTGLQFVAFERAVGTAVRATLFDVDGARIRTAPDIPAVAEAARWSQDGRSIILLAAEHRADRPAAEGSGGIAGAAPKPHWLPDVDDGSGAGHRRRAWRWRLDDQMVEPLESANLSSWEVDACGSAVVAIASAGGREGDWYGAALYLFGAAGPVPLFRSEDQLACPRGAPDGRHVACIVGFSSDRTLVAGNVVIVPADGSGGSRLLDVGGVDVSWIEWRSPDRLVYMGMRRFETVVGEVDILSGRAREIHVTELSLPRGAPKYPGGALLPDGVAAIREGYDHRPELVVIGLEVRPLLPIFPADAVPVGLRQSCRWMGRDGVELDGHLVLPETSDPHPPLIVLAHGGPVYSHRNTWGMNNIFTPLLIEQGYAVLHPDPRGSAARGQAFARMVQGDMGGEDAWDIASAIDALARRGLIDSARVGAMGRSYGGFISACLAMIHPVGAVIAMNNASDWYSRHYTANNPEFGSIFLKDSPDNLSGRYYERSLVRNAARVCAPVLNVAGLLDRSSRATQGLSFHRALLEAGKTSVLVTYPGEGHHIDDIEAQMDLCARMLVWFDLFVKNK